MASSNTPVCDALGRLREDRPEWNIWNSDAGAWYATRSGTVSRTQLFHGMAVTVGGDTLAGLIAGLHAQDLLADKISWLTARPAS